MLPKIIFCIAVLLAAIAVLFLALFSPIPHKHNPSNSPMLALSLYIQQPNIPTSNPYTAAPAATAAAGALIFQRVLTEGPENTSRVVGKAQGFIVPLERFAHSAFNIIYLTFHTNQFSGSLSIQAKNLEHKDKEELSVVGGTGSFAFARGLAVFAHTDLHATFHVKLHLEFPNN